jgi:thiol-disulfide isomerase/thioredoxin
MSLALAAGMFAPHTVLRLAHAATSPPDGFFARTYPDVDGHEIAMSSYLGQPLVLNFWATWCPPCVKEMPDLEALHLEYPQVGFVGLAADTSSNIQKFQEKVKVSYPLLVGGHGVIQLMRELGNQSGGLPFTLVFNDEGKIVQRFLGQVKPDELKRAIEHLGA